MKKKEIQSCNKNIFPSEPIERCHLRWHGLFFGVWRVLSENDNRYRKIKLGIIEALKEFGLFDDKTFHSDLFKLNPTDEILQKAEAFRTSATIPGLRGKKLPWERYDSLIALMDYSSTFFELRNFPRRSRTSAFPLIYLKDHLPKILSQIILKERSVVPEHLLKK